MGNVVSLADYRAKRAAEPPPGLDEIELEWLRNGEIPWRLDREAFMREWFDLTRDDVIA